MVINKMAKERSENQLLEEMEKIVEVQGEAVGSEEAGEPGKHGQTGVRLF